MVVEGKICNIPSPPHHYHSFLWSVMNWNGHGILLGAIFQSFTNNRNQKRSTTNATWKCETKQKQKIHKKGSWENETHLVFYLLRQWFLFRVMEPLLPVIIRVPGKIGPTPQPASHNKMVVSTSVFSWMRKSS